MKLHELRPAAGSKKAPKRIGRGTGSGLGRNAGKGEKGQNARSGGGVRPGFEGGQMHSYRSCAQRWLTNPFSKEFVCINVDRLNIFENGTEIPPEVLLERRVVSKVLDGVKILGNGTLEKSLTVKGCKFSKSAIEKIEAAGGKVEVM